MASGRIIHKTIHTSEQLADLEIGARYLYKAMIIHSDDKGRMKASPKFLKALVFPFDEVIRINTIKDWRDKISASGLILLYAADGQEYLVHPNWEKWQPLRSDRVKPSDCPDPTGCQPIDNHMSTKCPPNLTEPNRTKPNQTKEKKEQHSPSEEKKKYGDYVLLTEKQHELLVKLVGYFGLAQYIENLNNYIGSKGINYKSHYHTILTWWHKDGKPANPKDRQEREQKEREEKYKTFEEESMEYRGEDVSKLIGSLTGKM